MVDMSSEAVAGRLREVGRLLTQRGFVAKGVDMSATAVTARLRVLGALSDMCGKLSKLGEHFRSAMRSSAKGGF